MQSRYYDSKIGRFINSDMAEMSISEFNNEFCYCSNNPVMMIDPSGYAAVNVSKIPNWIFTTATNVTLGYSTKLLMKSIIYGAAKIFLQSKKYTLSRDMFYHAIYNNGKKITNSDKLGKDAIKKLKKSNLSYNISELLRRADRGSKILQGKYLKSYSNNKLSGEFTSGDLHYAIGKYSYTISASVYKEDFNKKSVRRYWKVNVVLTDTYDFEEVRAFENSILSDASNDLGLFMQKTGLLKKYNIELSYIDYTSEVQTA